MESRSNVKRSGRQQFLRGETRGAETYQHPPRETNNQRPRETNNQRPRETNNQRPRETRETHD